MGVVVMVAEGAAVWVGVGDASLEVATAAAGVAVTSSRPRVGAAV
jgi:hypothetical protein